MTDITVKYLGVTMVMAQWGQNKAAGAAGAVGAGLATEQAPIKVDLRVRAEWEESEQLVKYPLAIKVRDGRVEVVKPIDSDSEADDAGARGVWFYDPGDVDMVVYLYQNNILRHRWAYLKSCYLATDMCYEIFYAASEVWQNGGSVEDVTMRLSTITTYEKEKA
jgi:hypothetical protein